MNTASDPSSFRTRRLRASSTPPKQVRAPSNVLGVHARSDTDISWRTAGLTSPAQPLSASHITLRSLPPLYISLFRMHIDSMTFPSPPRSPSPAHRGPSDSSSRPYLSPHEYHLTNQSTPDLSRVASPTETVVDLPATAVALGEIPTDNFLNASAFSAPSPSNNRNAPQRKVNRLARRVHGWTWQAFPVGMGTGAV